MSRGVFTVTPELLVQLLHLPDGSRLIPPDGGRYFEFVVDHPDIKPDVPVEPMYERGDWSVRFVSWGQK
jgi:hypothetical protein